MNNILATVSRPYDDITIHWERLKDGRDNLIYTCPLSDPNLPNPAGLKIEQLLNQSNINFFKRNLASPISSHRVGFFGLKKSSPGELLILLGSHFGDRENRESVFKVLGFTERDKQKMGSARFQKLEDEKEEKAREAAFTMTGNCPRMGNCLGSARDSEDSDLDELEQPGALENPSPKADETMLSRIIPTDYSLLILSAAIVCIIAMTYLWNQSNASQTS